MRLTFLDLLSKLVSSLFFIVTVNYRQTVERWIEKVIRMPVNFNELSSIHPKIVYSLEQSLRR